MPLQTVQWPAPSALCSLRHADGCGLRFVLRCERRRVFGLPGRPVRPREAMQSQGAGTGPPLDLSMPLAIGQERGKPQPLHRDGLNAPRSHNLGQKLAKSLLDEEDRSEEDVEALMTRFLAQRRVHCCMH